jgi:predicted AAA+ superfamily ATPase
MTNLWTRLATTQVQEALLDTPVILIHGPRQCGKTTLAQFAAPDHSYITFDDQATLEAAQFDPVGFVKRLPEYVILDEVQHVPELFRAIKLSVDLNRKAGRFVLTGSANVLLLPSLSDSLAGRMEIINLLPLAYAETSKKSSPTLLQRLINNQIDELDHGQAQKPLSQRVIEGGFPEPLTRESYSRKRRWFDSYLQTLVQRDIKQISTIQKLDKIPVLLAALANNSAQLLNISSLSKDLGIDRATLNQYLALLQQIFLVEILPPWFSNRNKRLIKTPKAHLVDTGISSFLLGVDAEALEADRNLLGHLAENYVYAELKRHATGLETNVKFYHFRDQAKKEIDLIIETHSGKLIAVETKVASTVGVADFKILREFQETNSDKFTVGIVMYEGERILPFGEGLYAVPIAYL